MPDTIRARAGQSRRKPLQPADAGASIDPGTRKHSRPCSSAHDAVTSAPLRAPASITTTASEAPLISRFRCGNVPRVGWRPGRVLGDDGAAAVDDRVGQAIVRPRKQRRVAAADERDRRRLLRDARGVRRAVDADREARHDRRAGSRERRGDPARDAASGRAGLARARRPRRRARRRATRATHGRTAPAAGSRWPGGGAGSRNRRARPRAASSGPRPRESHRALRAASTTASATARGIARPDRSSSELDRTSTATAPRSAAASRIAAGEPSRSTRRARVSGPMPCTERSTASASRSRADTDGARWAPPIVSMPPPTPSMLRRPARTASGWSAAASAPLPRDGRSRLPATHPGPRSCARRAAGARSHDRRGARCPRARRGTRS